MSLAIAVVAGLLIGLSLGALGGGGSVLAVPVLVYALGQSAGQATTGSLVVVGVTSLVGAVTARRAGNVLLGRGVAFGAVAIGGAAGRREAVRASSPSRSCSRRSPGSLVVVAVVMAVRQVRAHRPTGPGSHGAGPVDAGDRSWTTPSSASARAFACQCPRALKVLVTATVVGLLTGFLGVGGGFLVVPALVLALGLPMEFAAGTSLVVITVTSAAALAVRAGTGTHPDWALVALLTVAAVVGGYAGARAATRVDTSRLQAAFTVLLLVVAGYTALQAIPALA